MSEKPSPAGRLSNAYLLLMTSLFFGAYTLFGAFTYAVAHGFSWAVAAKVGVCLFLFAGCCYLVNKRNYLNDQHQHRLLRNLDLSLPQALMVIGALLLWVLLRMVLFGTE